MEVRNSYDIVDDKIGRIYVGRRGFYGLVSKTINVNRKCPLCGGNKNIKLNGELYTCPKCNNFTFRFHTCKSRFCSSCGSKYVKQRSAQIQKKVFNCTHRHIVFTIPKQLRIYFLEDRNLLNGLFE